MPQESPPNTAPPQAGFPGDAPPPPIGGNRFFDWMRGLDLPRQPGWIGGVCAGIASRLGIDPLIVRGIAVVVAVLGGPALLLYAAAWLLLPDNHDKIHLEQVFRGKLEGAIAGIGALVLLSMLPVTQGFWVAGAQYWGAPSWGASTGRALWTLVVLGLIVWLVVWIARRANSNRATPSGDYAFAAPASGSGYGSTGSTAASRTTATSTPANANATPNAAPNGNATAAPFGPPSPNTFGSEGDSAATAPQAPASPAAGAPPEDVAAWREQQALWKAQHDAFRSQQAADRQALNQAAQERARIERMARRQADADERARTRSHPLYTFVVIGLALITGGVATLLLGDGRFDLGNVPAGLAATLAVLALGIIVNGVRGKRSGGSSAVAILVLIPLLIVSALPQGSHFQYGDAVTFRPVDRPGSAQDGYVVPFGNVTVDLRNFYDDPASSAPGTIDPVALAIGAGTVVVILPDDESINVDMALADGSIETRSAGRVSGTNEGETFSAAYQPVGSDPGDAAERRLDVTIRLGSGSITVIEPREGTRQ